MNRAMSRVAKISSVRQHAGLRRARRFTRLAVGSLLCAFGGYGCSVDTLESADHAPSKNSCEVQADCSAGSSCQANVCRQAQGEIDTVLLAITPASTTLGIGGLRFLVPLSGLRDGGQQFEVGLVAPSIVGGTVTRQGAAVNCDVHVTFTPVERVLGLSPDEYSAVTSGGRLSASIPAGTYEVYVQAPSSPAPSGCDVVPRLYRQVDVGAGVFQLPLELGEPSTLALSFIAQAHDLGGWRVAVLDSRSGRMLSPERTLDSVMLTEGSYALELPFNEVAGEPVAGQELIQLRPPVGVVAPTLIWKREGLEVFAPGELGMDLSQVSFEMGSYIGFVDGPDRTQQAATLTFTSIKLDGLADGVLGSFSVSTSADDSGAFAIESIPLGTYRVQVTPAEDSGLGSREVEVAVTAKGQGGATILLEARSAIAGTVSFDQPGAPAVAGATVQAVASPRPGEFDAFHAALGETPFVPRATSGVTSQAGTFRLDADPGTYNISVRPPAGSNLPWLVRTNVVVPLQSGGLGSLEIKAPVLQSGRVRLNDVAVAGAAVRAYAYLGSSGYVASREKAQSVVAVGEAYTDDDGLFLLALPSE